MTIVRPIDLKIMTQKETDSLGIFSFEPLPKGYGHTMGNVLRRTLLTSVEGSAITQVRIKGIQHQFSTIAGVKEDVVAITLNLKAVRLRNHSDAPVTASLSVSKEGLVIAGDFVCPPELEIVNKDAPIATITKKGTTLEMDITVENGYGYSPSEERSTSQVGVIILDALYTPIISVSYEVGDARFGRSIDLDKLTVTVETDGTISPKDALLESVAMIKGFFERIMLWESVPAGMTEADLERSPEASDVDSSAFDTPVDDLPLPTRTINALKKADILTVNDLKGKTEDELLDIKNVGQKSISELMKIIKDLEK